MTQVERNKVAGDYLGNSYWLLTYSHSIENDKIYKIFLCYGNKPLKLITICDTYEIAMAAHNKYRDRVNDHMDRVYEGLWLDIFDSELDSERDKVINT